MLNKGTFFQLLKSMHELISGIHNNGAAPGHWLIKTFAGEKDKPGILSIWSFNCEGVTRAKQYGRLFINIFPFDHCVTLN